MIKRIPIKGISRDPSGQIAEDGMCAESLNVQLDMGEVAPMMAPKEVNEYGDISSDEDILYIHQGNGYENLITHYLDDEYGNSELKAYNKEKYPTGIVIIDDHEMKQGEDVLDVVSVGNTLLVRTDSRILWLLYKEGNYIFLGDKIPEPDIKFISYNIGEQHADADALTGTTRQFDDIVLLTEIKEDVAQAVVDASVNLRNDYYGSYPFLVRYGVRLFDDRYVYISSPFLIGSNIDSPEITATVTRTGESPSYSYSVVVRIKSMCFNGWMKLNNWDIDNWQDIIKSLDVFVSPRIIRPDSTAEINGFTLNTGATYYIDYNSELTYEDLLTTTSEYYLAHRISFEEIEEYSHGKSIVPASLTSDDVLKRQEALTDSGYMSNHYLLLGGLKSYNNRLLATDVSYNLYDGPHQLTGVYLENPETAEIQYQIVFAISTGSAKLYIQAHNGEGGNIIETGELRRWITYPDTRCVEVYVSWDDARTWYMHMMKPLPSISAAYAYWDGPIAPASGWREFQYHGDPGDLPWGEDGFNYFVKSDGTIAQSDASNPFHFSPTGFVSFPGSIINTAVATFPVSEGQFGQFPVYVFTSEGIYPVSLNSEGDFVYTHPVSREILLSSESLVAIEQAIFFASARGLMLLQGSSVTKVSEYMDGKPDTLGNDLAQDIVSRYFSGATIEETAPFYQFLNGCKMAYDYANARILLYREGQPNMYVYKFNTQSWHRMAWNPLRTPVRTLNSYPEAFIVETDGLGHQFPMNYSTLSEDPEGFPLPGLIYTRELSLDGIDIYKTINRLKIRGRYADGHIKWALQGSNDGINFRTLHSLRGPSWKWYRIAIVSMLDAEERISYIELDYQPKFTNRLR